MVSNVQYHSFKGIDFRGKVPFVALLVVVAVFAVISLDPAAMFLLLFVSYALSGPLMAAKTWYQDRK